MPLPSPVRIPGGHSRAVFSIHCSAESNAADPASLLRADLPACEDGQDWVADPRRDSIGVAGAGPVGSGSVAGQGNAHGQARGLQMITTSLDRSVQLWALRYGADGVPCDAWKAAKVGVHQPA